MFSRLAPSPCFSWDASGTSLDLWRVSRLHLPNALACSDSRPPCSPPVRCCGRITRDSDAGLADGEPCRMDLWRWRPQEMKRKSKRKQKHVAAKSVLRLPDLEVAKSAVLNSLSCPDRSEEHTSELQSHSF